MRAWTFERYGEPDVMRLRDLPVPQPARDEVRVRVHATSLNASDMEFLRGKPAYIRINAPFRPRASILGSDIAGVVEAVGRDVTTLRPGDAVLADLMARGWGGLAEQVCAPASSWVRKPDDVPFDDAACLPQAGVVALQALTRKGALEAGQRVAINGAGGGSGSFAIQLAKRAGAQVTAIDRADKAELMVALGADHVVDYLKDDFTAGGARFDLIVDFVAHRSIFDYRRALAPRGRYVMVGGSVPRLLQTVTVGALLSCLGSRQMGLLLHEQRATDIETLLDLCRDGHLVPHIGHRFPLSQADEALRLLIAGGSMGKIVVDVVRD